MRLRGLSRFSIGIVAFIGLVALVALIASLGDMAATPRLKALSRESADYFTSFRQKGYSKPAYFDDMRAGNAWDYYTPMIALVESIDTDRGFLTDFINGVDTDTERAASLVSEADSALALLKKGVRRSTAAAPLDYEDGFNLRLPNYMALLSASRLLTCRARLLLNTDPTAAFDDLRSGLVFAGDVASGDLTLIGHTVGTVCLSISSKQIGVVLTELDSSQLEKLATDILLLSKQWPPSSRNLESEHRAASITLSEIGLDEYGVIGLPAFRRFPKEFLGWWVYHVLSWREIFSFRRTQLGAIKIGMEMASDLTEAEQEGWGRVRDVIDRWDSYKSRTGNWLFRIYAPNLMDLQRRQYRAVAEAKLAGTGALLHIYYRENGYWPGTLSQAGIEGLEDLLTDPITDSEFRYVVHADGDSGYVYSIGTDLEDDGGVADPETGDLVFVVRSSP